MPNRAGKSPERPTMRHIATLAGVSVMTVSRALRDNPRISDELREKIKAIALKLGYRPDPEVVKLMNHLRRRAKPTFVASIAAVTSLSASIEPPFLRRARLAAQARAAELGYALDVFRVKEPEKNNPSLERMLINRGIDGVLLFQMHAPSHVDQLLDWTKFSAVVATPSVLSPEFPRVGAHYFHNARLLCEELARSGCSRIGFLGPESFCIRTRHAFAAAAAWQCIMGGGSAVESLTFKDWHPSKEELCRWFGKERPDAIIVHAEESVPAIAEQLGLPTEGRSVLFACTNVDPLAAKWPGIDERHDLIGRKAVDVLTSLLNRNEKNLRVSRTSTLIEGGWVAGAPGASN